MHENEEEYDYIYKIVLIGDSSVGKSSILQRLTKNVFTNNLKSTIGVDFGSIIYTLDDKKIKLQIWDTAGQERYKAITSAYYRGAFGVIIVYDVTNKTSFDNINRWLSEINDNVYDKVPVIILANKIDKVERRVISKEEGESFCNAHNFFYAETSALLNDDNIRKTIETFGKTIFDQTVGVYISKKDEKNKSNININLGKPVEENVIGIPELKAKEISKTTKNKNSCC